MTPAPLLDAGRRSDSLHQRTKSHSNQAAKRKLPHRVPGTGFVVKIKRGWPRTGSGSTKVGLEAGAAELLTAQSCHFN